ncbi:hypothetical protein Pmani_004085 [Petrolisthes manimaculis]|uniref:Uncharacterized protein n=1 Tax=Petrolisthes manimaculis TaxID=1843537 RepID=A0AAE1QFL2_9EUCA|nr:hypothetical protein Pmani_004085 [Petrolisthes manimaculis]
MDRLTLTQAGSSYRHTHSHSSWQLLWIDSLSLKLAALIDTLTLTQAGSSYGQTQGYMVVNGTTYYIIRIVDH